MIQSLLQGKNLEMQVTRGYDRDIEAGFRDFFEDHHTWPVGAAKRQIIREATDRAEKLLEKLTKVGGDTAAPSPASPAAPAPRTAQRNPTTSTGLPPGVKLIN